MLDFLRKTGEWFMEKQNRIKAMHIELLFVGVILVLQFLLPVENGTLKI